VSKVDVAVGSILPTAHGVVVEHFPAMFCCFDLKATDGPRTQPI